MTDAFSTPVDEDKIRESIALRTATEVTEGDGASEKPPTAVEAARKRTFDLVENIATNTLVDLTRRRDELDNLMERIRTSQRALTHFIGEFARFNYEALELSKDVAKSIREATTPFAADPPATITQPKEGASNG